MWSFLHKLLSPRYYYEWTGKWIPWLGVLTIIIMIVGLYWGLVVAPPDYQQGDGYRIIFVHVPAAWMSMFVYVIMAGAGIIGLVWKIKLAEIVVAECAPIGASFTVLALITGMLWGKPMWGTYWVWDARLTSELILLFLYFGVIAIYSAIEDSKTAAKAASVFAIVGVINIPIIHYSVVWWNTLHQGATLAKIDSPSAHSSMLVPLLIMAVAFKVYFGWLLFIRTRSAILFRERSTNWVKKLIIEN